MENASFLEVRGGGKEGGGGDGRPCQVLPSSAFLGKGFAAFECAMIRMCVVARLPWKWNATGKITKEDQDKLHLVIDRFRFSFVLRAKEKPQMGGRVCGGGVWVAGWLAVVSGPIDSVING